MTIKHAWTIKFAVLSTTLLSTPIVAQEVAQPDSFQGGAITVGASDQNQYWASFSTYGSVVDACVLGVNTYSAFKGSNTAQALGSGTSFNDGNFKTFGIPFVY